MRHDAIVKTARLIHQRIDLLGQQKTLSDDGGGHHGLGPDDAYGRKRPDRIGPLLLLFLIVLLILALDIVYWTRYALNCAVATKFSPGAIQVVDGDTIRTNGLVYRLVGSDAPETYDAKCPQERALGERATARLRMIVDRGTSS
jgi:hypothetical protein